MGVPGAIRSSGSGAAGTAGAAGAFLTLAVTTAPGLALHTHTKKKITMTQRQHELYMTRYTKQIMAWSLVIT